MVELRLFAEGCSCLSLPEPAVTGPGLVSRRDSPQTGDLLRLPLKSSAADDNTQIRSYNNNIQAVCNNTNHFCMQC